MTMTEIFSPTSIEQFDPFESLSALQMEPIVSRVFKDIQVYRELLQAQPLNESEINTVMLELDGMWRQLLHEPAVFTGFASFPNEQLAEGSVTRDFYDRQQVEFNGVKPSPKDSEGMYESDDPQFYDLKIKLIRESINYRGEIVEVEGLADIDEIISLEFDRYMSPIRARRVLENYVPEIIDDIDGALLNGISDEAELAAKLSGLGIDQQECDDETNDLVSSALDTYVNYLIKFDHVNGYSLSVEGRVWVYKISDNPQIVHASTTSLAQVDRIVWGISPETDDDRLVPQLVTVLYGQEIDEASDVLHVPLTSVEEFLSIRSAYYRNS
jgi:hypothetical protein